MTEIICISNQIAGSGKTATAVSLAASFALMEKTTLLMDCDPQAAATQWLGIPDMDQGPSLYDAFMGQALPDDIMKATELDRLHILPSRIDLFQAEYKLAVKPGKEMILSRLARKSSPSFDIIVMDSPSTLGFFTVCTLAAADWLVIPFQPTSRGIAALRHLQDVVAIVQKELNPALRIAGILVADTGGHQPQAGTISDDGLPGGLPSFTTRIPHDKAVPESFMKSRPVHLHDIMSRGARSYLDFSVELINIIYKN
ncbi:MAG: ParA family protein [Thermodesulfobacteriota bacterium]